MDITLLFEKKLTIQNDLCTSDGSYDRRRRSASSEADPERESSGRNGPIAKRLPSAVVR